jgi:hypothetical protein
MVPTNKLVDPIMLSASLPTPLATIYFVLMWKPPQSNAQTTARGRIALAHHSVIGSHRSCVYRR